MAKPLEHRKEALAQFLRDWGVESGDGFNMPIIPAVLPVAVIDQADEFLCRTRPTIWENAAQSAVAAVYALVGVYAATSPVIVRLFEVTTHSSATVFLRVGTVDVRTANDATVTVTSSLPRGRTFSVQLLTGTTTVAAADMVLYSQGETHYSELNQGGIGGHHGMICLRKGEYIWASSATVNKTIGINVALDELQIQLQTVPEDLGA